MRTLAIVTLASLSFAATAPEVRAAKEESFDVWRFPLPEGWTKAATPGLFAMARGSGDSSCQIGLYASRAPGEGSRSDEIDREWKEVVEANYEAGEPRAFEERRLACGVVARGRAAATRAKSGTDSVTILLVLAPYGRVVSVVVNAPTAEALVAHDEAVTRFLDSLRIDVEAVASVTGPDAGDVAGASPLVGRWAASSGGGTGPGGVLLGSTKAQYHLRKDGSYEFKRESWGGSFRANEWFVVEESGTYAVAGNRLTIRPSKVSGVVRDRDGKEVRRADPALETVTYLARLVPFEGLGETQLVLTPPDETNRDGPFGGNERFRTSYLWSSKYRPEWRTAPK